MKGTKPLTTAIVVMCLVSLLTGCGDKSTTTEGGAATDSTATTTEQVELWLELDYDDVRLRESPNMDGKVISTHKMRTRLKYLNEMSAQNETVTLRNLEITAPWGKVATESGTEGWVFLGAVIPVPGKAAAEARKVLAGVKAQGCNGLQAGIDAFASAMKGMPAQEVDLAVPVLDAYLDSIALDEFNVLSAKPNYDDYGMVEMEGNEVKNADAILKEIAGWRACGLDMRYPEGMASIILKPGLTLPALSGLVTPEMKSYLEQSKMEDEQGWSEDAGLIITPKQLAERAVFWNDFTVKNPLFVYTSRMRNIADIYTLDLMLGQDNTPSISYETQKLDPEFQAAYDWLLKEHPGTAAAKVIREWYDLLKANGLKRTPKVEAFIQKRIEH